MWWAGGLEGSGRDGERKRAYVQVRPLNIPLNKRQVETDRQTEKETERTGWDSVCVCVCVCVSVCVCVCVCECVCVCV